jgi:hypothetical protein
MDVKYILNILIISILFLSFISIITNLNAETPFSQVVKMEGLENPPDTSIIMNKNDAFCKNHIGSSGTLDDSCKKLTKNNCNSTSCCVFTSDNKCSAGNSNGPTFNTDQNGKTKQLDYYYFQNKCYGNKCPKVV